MKEFRFAFELNVFSVFRLSQLAAPHMEKAGHGAILNVSSMAAENKNVRMAAYGASKAAESHLTRNMAFDLGPKGIRVNSIAPRGHEDPRALHRAHAQDREGHAEAHAAQAARRGAGHGERRAVPLLTGRRLGERPILTVSGGGVQELD